MDQLSSLLDRPIAYHRVFVRFGGVAVAVLLSQAVYWQKRTREPDGWWWKTQLDWHEETGLTRTEMETARGKLVSQGLMGYKREGLPARGWYRVDFDRLIEALVGPQPPEQSRLQESCKLDCRFPANQIEQSQHSGLQETRKPTITEITTETTSENSSKTTTTTSAPIEELLAGFPEIAALPKKTKALVAKMLTGRDDARSLMEVLANGLCRGKATGNPIRYPLRYLSRLMEAADSGEFEAITPQKPASHNQHVPSKPRTKTSPAPPSEMARSNIAHLQKRLK